MKIEYLTDELLEFPIIRLFDFDSDEAALLLTAVAQLASSSVECLEVHELPFVQSINDCKLTFIRRSWDQSTICTNQPGEFMCGFTSGTWDNVVGLIEPFTKESTGFQWLAGTPGEAALLLSQSGKW